MILDSFENIDIYKDLSSDLYQGLLYLKSIDMNISIGVHKVNSRVKAIVENYSTSHESSMDFESHKHVIDIQYPIIGVERVFWSPLDEMKIKIPYNKMTDCTYYKNPNFKSAFVDIGNNIFAIMFENDGHSPKHCVDSSQVIKKVTIKVSKL